MVTKNVNATGPAAARTVNRKVGHFCICYDRCRYITNATSRGRIVVIQMNSGDIDTATKKSNTVYQAPSVIISPKRFILPRE
jgi:hypothetical protein